MSQVIDLKDVMERVQDDKELLLELFDIFIEDFKSKRDGFWKAYEKHDLATFQYLAHGLKGGAGNISAMQIHENCINLDRMGKDGHIENAKSALELLDQQFEAFKVEVARIKAEFAK